jgi:hypothetical protein
MDDPEELNFGFSVARSLFSEAAKRSKGLARRFFATLAEDGDLEKIRELIAFYSVSFGLRDVEKQWIMYADKGRGVALGLAPEFFQPVPFDDPNNPKPEEIIFYGKVCYGLEDGRAARESRPRCVGGHRTGPAPKMDRLVGGGGDALSPPSGHYVY